MANEVVKLNPIDVRTIEIGIRGTSPLICHKWSQKALEQMRKKKMGDKSKDRSPCDPQEEMEAATYRLSDGSFGFPATGIKNSMATAANKDMGFPRTVFRRSLFVLADDTPEGEHPLVRIIAPARVMREDTVRVGMSSTDLRWRPEFPKWEMSLRIQYDTEWMTTTTIVGLIQRAGFGVGIGEWRPERDGDFGRFEVITQKES